MAAEFFIDAKLRLKDVSSINSVLKKIKNVPITLQPNITKASIQNKLNTFKTPAVITIKPDGRTTEARFKEFFRSKVFTVQITPKFTKGSLNSLQANARKAVGTGVQQATQAQPGPARAGGGAPRLQVPNLAPFNRQLTTAASNAQALGNSLPINQLDQLQLVGGSAGDRISQQLGFATASAESFGITLGVVLRRFAAFAVSSRLLIGIQSAIRGGAEALKDFEQGFADLQKVSISARSNVQGQQQDQINLAKSFSVTIAQVQELQTEFARQGRTAQEGAQLTEAALLGINAAGLTASEGLEVLTIATNVFNIQAEKASSIIDKLTSLADANAITVQDLTEAFRRSAAVFETVNLSFEEAASLITIVRENTRLSARQIGTSFKSVIPAVVAAQDQIEALGVTTRNALGQFDFVETIRGLKEVTASLPTEQRVQLIIDIVGKRQADRFITLVDNIGDIEEDLAIQAFSAGNALEKQAIQLDTFNSKLQNLRNTTFDLGKAVSDTGFSQIFKDGIEGVTELIDGFASIFKIVGEIGIPLGGLITSFVGFKVIIPALIGAFRGITQFFTALKQASRETNNTASGVRQISSAAAGIAPAIFPGIGAMSQFQQATQGALAVNEQLELSLRDQIDLAAQLRTESKDKSLGIAKESLTLEQARLAVIKDRIAQLKRENVENEKLLTNQGVSSGFRVSTLQTNGRKTPIGAAGNVDADSKAFKDVNENLRQRIDLQKESLNIAVKSQTLTKTDITNEAKKLLQLERELDRQQKIADVQGRRVFAAREQALFAGQAALEAESPTSGVAKDATAFANILARSGQQIKKDLRDAFFNAKTLNERIVIASKDSGVNLRRALVSSSTVFKANVSVAAQRIKTAAIAFTKSGQNVALAVSAFAPQIQKALQTEEGGETAGSKLVGNLQQSVFQASVLSAISKKISFIKALGILVAIQATIQLITAEIDFLTRQTDLEKRFEASNKKASELLKIIGSQKKGLRELADTDPADLEKRASLTSKLIADNIILANSQAELLALDREGLSALEKRLQLNEQISGIIGNQTKEAVDFASQLGSIITIEENREKKRSSAIKGALIAAAAAAAILFTGGAALPAIGAGAALAGAGGAAAGVALADTEEVKKSQSGFEKIIELQAKLRDTADDELKVREKIEKEIQNISKRLSEAQQLVIQNARLGLKEAQNDRDRQIIAKDFVLNLLQTKGVLGAITDEEFKQAGILELLKGIDKARLQLAREQFEELKKDEERYAKIKPFVDSIRDSTFATAKNLAKQSKQLAFLETIFKSINRLQAEFKEFKFQLGIGDIQNQIDKIRLGVDSVPSDIQLVFTTLIDTQKSQAQLNEIERQILERRSAIQGELDKQEGVRIVTKEQQKIIDEVFKNADAGNLAKAFAGVNDLVEGGNDGIKKFGAQLKEILELERERVKQNKNNTKAILESQKAQEKATAAFRKSLTGLVFAGADLTSEQTALLKINEIQRDRANSLKDIRTINSEIKTLQVASISSDTELKNIDSEREKIQDSIKNKIAERIEQEKLQRDSSEENKSIQVEIDRINKSIIEDKEKIAKLDESRTEETKRLAQTEDTLNKRKAALNAKEREDQKALIALETQRLTIIKERVKREGDASRKRIQRTIGAIELQATQKEASGRVGTGDTVSEARRINQAVLNEITKQQTAVNNRITSIFGNIQTNLIPAVEKAFDPKQVRDIGELASKAQDAIKTAQLLEEQEFNAKIKGIKRIITAEGKRVKIVEDNQKRALGILSDRSAFRQLRRNIRRIQSATERSGGDPREFIKNSRNIKALNDVVSKLGVNANIEGIGNLGKFMNQILGVAIPELEEKLGGQIKLENDLADARERQARAIRALIDTEREGIDRTSSDELTKQFTTLIQKIDKTLSGLNPRSQEETNEAINNNTTAITSLTESINTFIDGSVFDDLKTVLGEFPSDGIEIKLDSSNQVVTVEPGQNFVAALIKAFGEQTAQIVKQAISDAFKNGPE